MAHQSFGSILYTFFAHFTPPAPGVHTGDELSTLSLALQEAESSYSGSQFYSSSFIKELYIVCPSTAQTCSPVTLSGSDNAAILYCQASIKSCIQATIYSSPLSLALQEAKSSYSGSQFYSSSFIKELNIVCPSTAQTCSPVTLSGSDNAAILDCQASIKSCIQATIYNSPMSQACLNDYAIDIASPCGDFISSITYGINTDGVVTGITGSNENAFSACSVGLTDCYTAYSA